MDLELIESKLLIEELTRRSTFAGIVIFSDKEFKNINEEHIFECHSTVGAATIPLLNHILSLLQTENKYD